MAITKHNFGIITERVEKVRKLLNMRIPEFCESLAITRQYYENYVGVQNSKPSVKLIYHTCVVHNVASEWLLFGIGDMLVPDSPEEQEQDAPPKT